VFALVHALLIAIGLLLVALDLGALVEALGVTLLATGIAGYVTFAYVLATSGTRDRLEAFSRYGIAAAYPGRSVTIREEYGRRLAAAKNQIDVLGFGLRALRQDYADDFAAWARRATVRVLLLDPEYPKGNLTIAAMRDFEEGNEKGEIAGDVHAFLRAAAPVVRSSGGRFKIRLYHTIPAVNIFRIDDDLFFGPYLVDKPSRNSPTLRIERGGELFDPLVDHFEKLWGDDRFSRVVPADWMPSE
jgi:hypothetical protein